jgi:hypothetical protein
MWSRDGFSALSAHHSLRLGNPALICARVFSRCVLLLLLLLLLLCVCVYVCVCVHELYMSECVDELHVCVGTSTVWLTLTLMLQYCFKRLAYVTLGRMLIVR